MSLYNVFYEIITYLWYNPADAFRRIVDITWIEAEFSFAMKILNKMNKYGYIQVIYIKIYIYLTVY